MEHVHHISGCLAQLVAHKGVQPSQKDHSAMGELYMHCSSCIKFRATLAATLSQLECFPNVPELLKLDTNNMVRIKPVTKVLSH